MSELLHTVKPPAGGLWRVGRKKDPLAFYQPEPPELGHTTHPRHRFDDLLGRVPTLYFSTAAEAAVAETAMPLRPKHELTHLLPDDDSIGASHISAEYRSNRLLVQAELTATDARPNLVFVDLESAENLLILHTQFGEWFDGLGLDCLTLGEVHGRDRRITSAIASALMHAVDDSGIPLFAGARYTSKYGAEFENFVVFGGVEATLLRARPIELTDPSLQAVARCLKLHFN